MKKNISIHTYSTKSIMKYVLVINSPGIVNARFSINYTNLNMFD
jgi:hypothetical protein